MAYLGKTPSQAVRSRYYYTATGGETSLSGADDNSNVLTFTDGNYVDVSLNGVALVAGTDYNTTTTNTIGGLTALVASDVVEVIVYDTFSVFSGNVTGDFTVGGTLTAANITNTGNLNFGDNDKAIFGDGSDLQIYHDGSNSIIDDTGSGRLYLRSDPGVIISKYTGETCAQFNADADVKLYYDNSAKLATTSTGVDVTGGLNTTGNVGIGTSTPDFKAEIVGGTNDGLHIKDAESATVFGGLFTQASNMALVARSNHDLTFGTNDTERWRINTAGHMVPANTNNGIILGSTASVASNLLNDYEEGTFTLTEVAGSITGDTARTGSYVKIGRMVMIDFQITGTALTISSYVGFSSLPFTPSNPASGYASTEDIDLANGVEAAVGTNGILYLSGGGGSDVSRFSGSMVYRTA